MLLVKARVLSNKWFVVGCILYLFSAFGWVFVMRHIKLSSLGLVYSLFTVILLAGLGVVVFGETLNRHEFVGIMLGIASILLLSRFGG